MTLRLRFADPDDLILHETIPTYEGDPQSLRPLAVAMWETMRKNRPENYERLDVTSPPPNGIGVARINRRKRTLYRLDPTGLQRSAKRYYATNRDTVCAKAKAYQANRESILARIRARRRSST